MIFGRSTIASLTTLALFTSPLAEARAKTVSYNIGAHEVRGHELVRVLAATCSKDSFTRFSAWATKSGIAKYENHNPMHIQVEPGQLSEESTGLHVARVGSEIEMRWGQHTVKATDPCEVLTAMHAELMKTRHASAVDELLLPRAFAADRVKEDRVDNSVDVLFGAGGVLLALGGVLFFPVSAPMAFLAGAMVLYDGYSAVQGGRHLLLKDQFEHFLNRDFTITCDASTMILKQDNHEIVVRKIANHYTIDAFDSHQLKPAFTTSDFDEAPESAKYIKKLAKDCDSPEAAARISEELKKEQTETKDRVVALEDGSARLESGSQPAPAPAPAAQ